MKAANIIPVHKGGSRGLAKNYRPIALTSHLIKVFEKVLSKSIVAFMEINNLARFDKNTYEGFSIFSATSTSKNMVWRENYDGATTFTIHLKSF